MHCSIVCRTFRPGIVLIATSLIAVVNCEQVDVTLVDPARVELSPPSATVTVSQATQLTATVLSTSGRTVTGHEVEWTSLHPTIASVDSTGMVRGMATGSAKIRALAGQASDTATITVLAPSSIALTPSEVPFSAVQNAARPANKTVDITNSGTGTLSGLAVAVQHTAGEPTGWLTASLTATTAPTTVVLSVNQASLVVGTYTATVNVSADDESSALTVRLTVFAPSPAIGLETTSVSFAAARGGANPDSQVVAVTNAGAGTLSGLTVGIGYTSGQPTGWLTASLSGTTAPATLRLHATTGSLAVGVYRATVSVSSAVAQNSPQNLEVTFRVQEPAPAPPTNLVATTKSATQIDLSWTAPAGTVQWYRIERKTGAAYARIDSVPGNTTTYNNTGLAAATQYFYRVQACNASGCSPFSNEASATTLPNPPGVPAGLTATAVSQTQISLNWSGPTGTVDRYRIARRTGSNQFAVIDSVSAGTFTYQNMGLTPATGYDYQVSACNAGGCSAPATASATTLPNPPGVPSGLAATAVSPTQINLSWNAAAGTVDRYRIARRTGGDQFVVIDSVPAGSLTYQNTVLAPATGYDYQVSACNAGGCSAFSTTASATTPPTAPSSLSATEGLLFITLNWTASSGSGLEYIIERKLSTAQDDAYAEVGRTSGTSHQDGLNLAPLLRYNYRVRACTATGVCSAYSNVVTAGLL